MKTLTIALIGAAALLAACSDDGPDDDMDASAAAGAGAGSGVEQGGLPPADSVEYFNVVVGDRVFFGTDRHDLSAEAQETLRKQAEWLAANPNTSAVIEGHADERGTREYNLALGDRRANAVRNYLMALGIDQERILTISYGEERPADPGHDESAWAQNRRAVTMVATTG